MASASSQKLKRAAEYVWPREPLEVPTTHLNVTPLLQVTAQLRLDILEAAPGLPISLLNWGDEPCAQVQQGSPSSNPLDWPSPSLSFKHRA